MDELNQFAISKALGSTITHLPSLAFGNFNLRSTHRAIDAEYIRQIDDGDSREFTYKDDEVIVRAFEETRHGSPTDELLWNKALAKSFAARCRRLGINASNATLIRRLINVRKNAPRYAKHGIVIGPTTKSVSHPSIVPQYAHVIEFALVKLRFRFGASIDDILMDPALGEEFEKLAHEVAPNISSENLRLGALYIRKNRVIGKADQDAINALDVGAMNKAWQGGESLAETRVQDVPPGPGLIELRESERYLYVAQNANIGDAVHQLQSGNAFRLMSNDFWEPKLEQISILFAPGRKIEGTPIDKWERKLVYDLDPVFNWPMARKAA